MGDAADDYGKVEVRRDIVSRRHSTSRSGVAMTGIGEAVVHFPRARFVIISS